MDDEAEDAGPDPYPPTMKLLDEGNCLWCPGGKGNQPVVDLDGYGGGAGAEICQFHLRRALALFEREPPN